MPKNSSINRADAVPLYHQIFLTLRDQIISGVRGFGTTLPTEQELSRSHKVSRITARRALHELAQHGFVERRRRTGTRIVFRSRTQPIETNVDQAVESLLAFGRNTKVRVLALARVPCETDVAEKLGIRQSDPVERAVRVRALDGEPLGEVISYVPATLGLNLTRRGLAATPILGLLLNAGHVIGGGTQTISATVADGRLASLLDIDMRAPILRIERVVLDRSGMALLLTVANYRADRYRISVDLQTQRTKTRH